MIYIRQGVYEAIEHAFTAHAPECGGVLGACDEREISEFYFDETGRSLPDVYVPDVERINDLLESVWAPRGVQMVGMIHSHGNAGSFPSCGDLYYCEQIMKHADIRVFYLPIVTLAPFELTIYQVRLQDERLRVEQMAFELIDA